MGRCIQNAIGETHSQRKVEQKTALFGVWDFPALARASRSTLRLLGLCPEVSDALGQASPAAWWKRLDRGLGTEDGSKMLQVEPCPDRKQRRGVNKGDPLSSVIRVGGCRSIVYWGLRKEGADSVTSTLEPTKGRQKKNLIDQPETIQCK